MLKSHWSECVNLYPVVNVLFLSQGVRNIASVCLQIGYPTLASIPHSIINGYKRVLAVAVETDYSFPLAEKVTPIPFIFLCVCLMDFIQSAGSVTKRLLGVVLSFPLHIVTCFSNPLSARTPRQTGTLGFRHC